MIRAPFALLLAIALAGCGRTNQRVGVEGEIRFDGQPLASGTVVFAPDASTRGPSTGSAIIGGKYRVAAEKGLLPGGSYRVEITSLRKSGKKIPSALSGPAPTYDLVENFIPPRYNRESNLTATASGETNPQRIDFLLDGR